MAREYFLHIKNQSPAQAREVALLLDGKPVSEHKFIVSDQREVKEVGPLGEIEYSLGSNRSRLRAIKVLISWQDDSVEAGKWEGTVTP